MSDLDGVDVASYQGLPGQWTGVAGRISWAAVKITELGPGGSRYVNPDAAADLAYLAGKRLGRIFYLFAHPGADPAATVQFFVTEARDLGITDHDGVMLDHETTDGKTPAEVSAWAQAVLSGLERELDRTPLVYSYPDFIESGNCAGCEKYPLWISDPDHPAGHPVVPRPWRLWAIHQFGTSGAIDRDVAAYTSLREMQAVLGKRGAAPVHRVPPKPPKPKRHVAKKTARAVAKVPAKTKTAVKKEPALTAGTGAGALSAAVVFLQHKAGLHLDATQVKAIVTALVALAGVLATLATRPVRYGVLTTAASAAGAAAATFGAGWPLSWTGAEMPLAGLVVASLMRMHVSPAFAAEAEAVVTAVAPATPAAPAAPVPPVT